MEPFQLAVCLGGGDGLEYQGDVFRGDAGDAYAGYGGGDGLEYQGDVFRGDAGDAYAGYGGGDGLEYQGDVSLKQLLLRLWAAMSPSAPFSCRFGLQNTSRYQTD